MFDVHPRKLCFTVSHDSLTIEVHVYVYIDYNYVHMYIHCLAYTLIALEHACRSCLVRCTSLFHCMQPPFEVQGFTVSGREAAQLTWAKFLRQDKAMQGKSSQPDKHNDMYACTCIHNIGMYMHMYVHVYVYMYIHVHV